MRKIGHIFFITVCLCLLVCGASDLLPRAYAASSMTASDACIELIKAFEGFSPEPYFDYNQYTVGYGTKCPSEKYFEYKANGIPKREAEALLRQELIDVADDINQKFIDKNRLTLSQHQFDALVSFSYNIGTGWITSNSTLKNAILSNANQNDLVYAFGLYCTAGGKYLPGLVTRRLCEANMYLNGVYSKNVNDAFGYVYYDANGGSVTYRVQAFICENNTAPAANAAKNGDTFLGWYTDLTGGTQVSTLNRELTGKTLFARWQSTENTFDQNPVTATITVTGDVVNIRSGPGTNYGTVKQVYRNDVLTVSHVTHLTNMKWGKVPSGWICLDFTNYDAVVNGTGNSDTENSGNISGTVTVPDNTPDTTVPVEPQTALLGYVNVNDFLNIRSGPGTAYSTVGFLFRGSKVSILEQRSAGSTVWGKIEKGWVCMDYIVTDKNDLDESIQNQDKEPTQNTTNTGSNVETVAIQGKITADALRIRSGAGTTYPIVGFYYQNDSVTVSEKKLVDSVYWGKTSKGWISMDYVLPNSSTAEPSQPTGNEMRTITADCLRIRKDAGTEHKIVGFLYYGDKVTILETKDVSGALWGKVSNGWVSMEYVN